MVWGGWLSSCQIVAIKHLSCWFSSSKLWIGEAQWIWPSLCLDVECSTIPALFIGWYIELCCQCHLPVSVVRIVAVVAFRGTENARSVAIVSWVLDSMVVLVGRFCWDRLYMFWQQGIAISNVFLPCPLVGIFDHLALLTGWQKSCTSTKKLPVDSIYSWLLFQPGHMLWWPVVP